MNNEIGIKYKLIGDNKYDSKDIFGEVLKNRGVDERIFRATKGCLPNPKEFKNMELGAKKLIKHIKKGSNITALCDSDPDGITSITMLIKYIEKTFESKKLNIRTKLHKNRTHGIILKE